MEIANVVDIATYSLLLFHPEVKSNCLPLETELALVISLTNRTEQK